MELNKYNNCMGRLMDNEFSMIKDDMVLIYLHL